MTLPHPALVLVVDDDASGRAILALSLRQAGYEVKVASNGEDALHLLAQFQFDWMITDARMHPMTGFELSVRAKALQTHLKILMVSALYTQRDAAGFPVDKFLPKPIPVEQVLDTLGAAA